MRVPKGYNQAGALGEDAFDELLCLNLSQAGSEIDIFQVVECHQVALHIDTASITSLKSTIDDNDS